MIYSNEILIGKLVQSNVEVVKYKDKISIQQESNDREPTHEIIITEDEIYNLIDVLNVYLSTNEIQRI